MKKLLAVALLFVSSIAIAQDVQPKKELDILNETSQVACSSGPKLKEVLSNNTNPLFRGVDGSNRALYILVAPTIEKVIVVRFEDEDKPNERGCVLLVLNAIKYHEKNLKAFVEAVLGTPI